MRRAILALFALITLGWNGFAQTQSLDLILQGGRIVDGTGNPWYAGDVGIRDGLIVEVGDLSGRSATRTIRVKGLVVSPGFVDLMGGSSLPLLRDPISARSKLYQGITTMLVGEGGSLAPQTDDTLRALVGSGETDDFPGNWYRFSEYFQLLESRGIALNVVHNVGAAQVRRVVIGDEDKDPTPGQLSKMKELVRQAMEDGAIGLSTALIYPPGAYAETEEIIELARVAAENTGVYFTHMRNESHHLLEAIEEAIHVGREAGLPVQIYHLKAAGQDNWGLMSKALERIAHARSEGIDITADIYPYIRNGIGLGSFLHPRHYAEGAEEFLVTLSDPEVRNQLRKEIESSYDWENWYRHVGKDWAKVLISRVPLQIDASFVGLSIQEVAKKRRVDVWQAFFDLVQEGGVSVNPQSMNEKQKHQALRAPFVMFDTDAAPTNPEKVASAHPRAFGTFPRILAKYVREEDVISLEEAIRKMTSLAANRLKLYDRGRISPGLAADIAVFDPVTIQDTATFTKPISYARGIEYLIINGELVIDDGMPTSSLPGKVIRHGRR